MANDPMGMLRATLAYGRQKNGLPASFFDQVAGNIPGRPAGPGGDQPNPNPFPIKNPTIPFGKRTAQADTGVIDDGDADDVTAPVTDQSEVPDETNDDETQSFAEGGSVTSRPGSETDPRVGPSNSAGPGEDDKSKVRPNPQRDAQGSDWKNVPQDQPGVEVHFGGRGFADGGVIPDGGEDDGDADDQGGDPSQGQQGQGGQNPQMITGYLQGADALPGDVAQALEASVDPQGTMDPSLRRLLAMQQAGGPQHAWGLLQNYRQKFNAHNAFAQAALDGGPGKPGDIAAAARAATKAYQYLPDGKSVQFMPGQGGVSVKVNDLAGQSQGQSQQPQTQSFDAGGAVEDEPYGADDDQGVIVPVQSGQAAGDGETDDGVTLPVPKQGQTSQQPQERQPSFLGMTPPHQALRDVFLSIPAFKKFLKEDGQADKVLESGFDKALKDAQGAQGANPMAPGAAGTFAPNVNTQQRPQGTIGNTIAPPAFQGRPGQPGAQQQQQSPQSRIDPELMRSINARFPYVSQGAEREAAIEQAIGGQQSREQQIEVAKQQGINRTDAARLSATGRTQVAQINGDVKRDVVNTQETNRNGRAQAGNENKRNIAGMTESGRNDRFQQGERGKNVRTAVTNAPGLQKDATKLNQTAESMGDASRAPRGPAQPQQQQQAQPEMKLVKGKWYMRGPNGEAVPVQ